MFNRKTLFIIGAGAGFDIGMPVGRQLAEDIARRTRSLTKVTIPERCKPIWDIKT